MTGMPIKCRTFCTHNQKLHIFIEGNRRRAAHQHEVSGEEHFLTLMVQPWLNEINKFQILSVLCIAFLTASAEPDAKSGLKI